MTPRATLRLAMTVVGVALLAACGSSSSSSDQQSSGGAQGGGAAPALPDACSLLTQSEASTLYGGSVDAGAPTQAMAGSGGCSWKTSTGGHVDLFEVSAGSDAVNSIQGQIARAGCSGTFSSISGVGDAASFCNGSRDVPAVRFAKHGIRVELECVLPYCPQDRLVPAAKQAADRMP